MPDLSTPAHASPTADVPPVDDTIVLLRKEQDAAAAAVLAPATGGGTVAAASAALTAARDDPETELFGRHVDGELVAVYGLRSIGMTREVVLLAVAPPHRRRGHGRACLQDALRRAGKRPLVVETDADALSFYQAVGFKLVGKRHHPSGSVRYRLGWHAPRPPAMGAAPLMVLPSPSRGRGAGGEGLPPPGRSR